ncbi:BMP family ABC transporter substrate-binding protein [Parabacteroides provencensis]|uniref:BMP family ABC transporter substrate-binding protein n=1 Tax=Parabacteroides provencensis TaxID=1944636 RepID=UPI000C147F42|nr:BMP family ABC transporter substrate-binding protein [Parabacteroides provencensis]
MKSVTLALLAILCLSCSKEEADYTNCKTSKEVVQKFHSYFCYPVDKLTCQLDGYMDGEYVVQVTSSDVPCQLFSDITGIKTAPKDSYEYSFVSDDGISIRINGKRTSENAIYATWRINIPEIPGVSIIHFASPDIANGTNGEPVGGVPVIFVAGTRYEVRVLFTPGGLGDLSYNDDIFRGILQEQKQTGFYLRYNNPLNIEKAKETLEQWMAGNNSGNIYTIVAGSEYEQYLKNRMPSFFSQNYLFFETDATDFTYPVFCFSGYGVSFLTGIMAYSFIQADTAAYLGGQQKELYVEECYAGFRDGYLHAGGKEVVANYLSSNPDGFVMSEQAYKMADSLYTHYPFLLAVAGGANNGVYQYLREHPQVKGYTAGVDCDQSAYSSHIIGSMVKKTGDCVGAYIRQWIEGKNIPMRQLYGLESGYTYFQLADSYKPMLEHILKGNYCLAIEKEYSYHLYDKL